MPDTFQKRIQIAINDTRLQEALDANARRRIEAHANAIASLPQDWKIMRQQAHAIRQQVTTNLEQILNQFKSAAERNGLIIHEAHDATEAVQLVLDIARRKGAHLIAKSKTMVSEEIKLNHALEADGMRVVETDLGEYIVQLRDEPPAHIITPAVHLRRQDVGQTFHEKLGVPLTDDISTLTTTARKLLRQVFLDADIGISGVNMAVAESGTLCILTNEGNGRMVTTLPPVHIALLGIERLVPTFKDLAHMLYLLPRAATGQKITVYTNLINSPRRGGELDGPQERHVILVDNGRRQVRNSPIAEVLDCIRCGACINACPVFKKIGGHAYVDMHATPSTYPGPIGSVISPGLFGYKEYGHLARASSLCGACRDACPVEIDLPKLLLRVRSGMVPSQDHQRVRPNPPSPIRWGLRLYTWLATSRRRFAAAQILAHYLSGLLPGDSNWIRLPAFTGWGSSKDLPRPSARSFKQRWAARQATDHNDLLHSEESGGEDRIQTKETYSASTTAQQLISSQSQLERFSTELSTLGATITILQPENLPARLLQWLQDRDIDRIQSWGQSQLPPGLLAAIQQAGIQTSSEPSPDVRAGLTATLAGIAETGSLLITGGESQPLTASLLPGSHLAILQQKDIVPTLDQALELPQVRQSSSAVLISGPSRTADIEMTLTIGVHGPEELHVFCLIA